MKLRNVEKSVQEANELMKHGATLARALTMTGLTITQYQRHSSVPKVTTADGSRIKARTLTLALHVAHLIDEGMSRAAALKNAGISGSSYKRAGVGRSAPEPIFIGEKRVRQTTIDKANEAHRLIKAGLPVLKACGRADISQASYRIVHPKPPLADVRAFLDAVAKTKRENA